MNALLYMYSCFCHFGDFYEGFISKFREKNLRIGKTTLSFTDIGKSRPCHIVLALKICVLKLFENKILAKYSFFTVLCAAKQHAMYIILKTIVKIWTWFTHKMSGLQIRVRIRKSFSLFVLFCFDLILCVPSTIFQL